MKVTFMPHQQDGIDTYPDRWGVFWGTGVGKTYFGLGLLDSRLDLKSETGIVICPKIVKANWIHHIKDQGLAPEDNNGFGIHVYTKEEVLKYQEEIYALKNVQGLLDDEAHFHLGTKMKTKSGRLTIAGSLKKLLQHHNPRCFYPMTATPYRSSPWDLYTMWQLVHAETPMKYTTFQSKFFYRRNVGPRFAWKPKQDPVTEEIINRAYQKCGTFLEAKDVFDLPPIIEEAVFFQPTASALDAINNLDTFDASVRYGKVYQILNGTLKGDEYEEDQEFTCDKFDWVMNYQEENDENIFIVCRHKREIERYKVAFASKGVKTYEVSGDVKPDFNELNADTDRYVVIGQAQSLVGFDILNVDTMIFHSLSFSYVDYTQAKGRITRGQSVEGKDHLKYYTLVIPDTIDEAVTENINNKKDFSMSLYAGVED